MKIGILHLTDLHIQDNYFPDRIDKLTKSIGYDIKQISHIYIVFSGDIANYGRKNEFDKAKEFVSHLKTNLKNNNRLLQIELVVVPGNHDCCFDDEKKTRKSILNDCRTDVVDEEDYFIDAMAVQNFFWEFANEITTVKEPNLASYKLDFRPHLNFKVSFHCYNSSWLTEIDEKQGNLIVPENKFLENENGEYVISVFHHPLDWLSANTRRNNKQRFEEHLIKTSNLVLYGHEHDKGKSKAIIQQKQNVVFCGGKAFNIKDSKDTGFSYYEIDLTDKSINIKTYVYNDEEYYLANFEDTHKIILKNKRSFVISIDFEEKISQLSIPLKHSKKEKLTLSDVFIYPDLEPLVDDDYVQYPNSSELVDLFKDKDSSEILLEGADQSGKTSLLFVLYKRLYELGFNPIYLRGKYCNKTNIKKLLKKSLKEQYNSEDIDLFFQQDKKVLLLDNIHKSELNPKYKKNLIDSFIDNFDYVVITSDSTYNSRNVTEEATSFKNFKKYKVLPLGHEKRSELIEQWLMIGQDKLTVQEEVILAEVKSRFAEIDALIGNRLMPAYPVFILTLLQSLDENLQNFSQTSYANIYLVLIKAGLVKEGVKDNELTSLLNILKELSYHLYENLKALYFNNNQFEEFILEYSKNYFRHEKLTIRKILTVLCNANILKFDDENFSFSYKYIYYFLVAQKIATDIDKHQDTLYDLCDNIHLEINANILIFLSHHSKAQILIDSIILTSQIPFENFVPLSLNKDDEFVKFISEFTKEIKHEIIEEINPKDEVKKDLQRKDAHERSIQKVENKYENDETVLPSEVVEMNQAFRTIKIIGQIVKNQSGDFEKDKLINLVEAAYNTMFRFLGFYSEILVRDKDLLIESLVENIKEKESNNRMQKIDSKTVEKAVKKMLQFISWRICVDSMSNLMFSVGTKGQNELFEKVSSNIDSTASKLVTFAIKTFYDKIDTKELSKLFEDVKDNYLAQCILREYIKRYLYTNFVERNKRDQIITIAGFNKQKMIPKLATK